MLRLPHITHWNIEPWLGPHTQILPPLWKVLHFLRRKDLYFQMGYATPPESNSEATATLFKNKILGAVS